jgi:DNA-binding ferritin-like protein
MDKKYVDFICSLHGYCIRTKEIHWSTENNSTHLLCDEIMESIDECEDRFAECLMGETGKKFKVGDLKPLLPNSETLMPMLRELEKEVIDMKKSLDEYKDGGLINVCDDLLEICNKYKYRCTQK